MFFFLHISSACADNRLLEVRRCSSLSVRFSDCAHTSVAERIIIRTINSFWSRIFIYLFIFLIALPRAVRVKFDANYYAKRCGGGEEHKARREKKPQRQSGFLCKRPPAGQKLKFTVGDRCEVTRAPSTRFLLYYLFVCRCTRYFCFFIYFFFFVSFRFIFLSRDVNILMNCTAKRAAL